MYGLSTVPIIDIEQPLRKAQAHKENMADMKDSVVGPDVRVGRETMGRAMSTQIPSEWLDEDIDDDNLDPPQAVKEDAKDDADGLGSTFSSNIFFEPPIDNDGGNISNDGLQYIANHKYRPSDYTHLDNILNPMWTWLTELLPMWMAPNLVTTLGGLHCGLAFGILWWYSPDYDQNCPDWTFLLAAWCTVAYYTLDCMDGKQARRTGSSSPLGQLFDHGFDCICTLFFLATIGSYTMIGGTYWYIGLQTSLQFSFFMAQWEEYHTHVLPHCAGKWFGVTEMNHAMAVLSFANAFVDRVTFWQRSMDAVLIPYLGSSKVEELVPLAVREMELRHFCLAGWGVSSLLLIGMSLNRALTHPHIAGPSLSSGEITRRRLTAVSKLATPFALCVAGFLVPPDAVRTRYLSVTLGLAFSLITKKMIVFSMAKMSFAVVQWEALPLLLAAVWIRFDDTLTTERADFGLGLLCFYYTFRLLLWANVTIGQICKKLDIYCFTLKEKKE